MTNDCDPPEEYTDEQVSANLGMNVAYLAKLVRTQDQISSALGSEDGSDFTQVNNTCIRNGVDRDSDPGYPPFNELLLLKIPHSGSKR